MSREGIGAVIATKDRPGPLRRTLDSLSAQERVPDATVVVDASEDPSPSREVVVDASDALRIRHVVHQPPSAAAQRNRGVRMLPEVCDRVAFFDDDIELGEGALQAATARLSEGGDDLLAVGFNLRNPPESSGHEDSSLLISLGLYPSAPGEVAPSGWQRIAADVDRDLEVQWLPTGAALWRRSVFDERGFEEEFRRYSYLEDLEFSYWASRRGRLVVCAEAEFRHMPAESGRVDGREFGRVEVQNRRRFVQRYDLDRVRLAAMLTLRMAKTARQAVRNADHRALCRLRGNLAAL